MSDAVVVKNLSHSFHGHQVLQDITFRVEKGETFGLLGPSGAGKTTLIRILTGQLRQEAGTAEIFGRDTKSPEGRKRGQIGAMMDSFGLYERLSVYDNLAFYADIYHISRAVIPDILKSIGLYEGRRTAASKLSKGMKNRLSLARALMGSAKLLFLDEPTAGLDPATTKEIHAVLAKEKEKGTTVFLTTHNMLEAEKLCDHIALLHNGSIMEYGAPADIRKKYDHQNRLCVTLKGGERVMLEKGSASAQRMKEYLEKDMVEAVHSTEPTLETVFIELAGKGLE